MSRISSDDDGRARGDPSPGHLGYAAVGEVRQSVADAFTGHGETITWSSTPSPLRPMGSPRNGLELPEVP